MIEEVVLTPGLSGWLEFRTRPHEEYGIIEHAGAYRYLGEWQGMLCFADCPGDVRCYLHPDEVLSFTTRQEALS